MKKTLTNQTEGANLFSGMRLFKVTRQVPQKRKNTYVTGEVLVRAVGGAEAAALASEYITGQKIDLWGANWNSR